MSPSTPPSLASGRKRRKPKPTARAQQMLDEQQERAERGEQAKEQAKEKALVTRQAKVINKEGDDLMYRPVKRPATPTVTGNDDSDDQEQLEQAEATYLLQLLAHRGDGDWAPYYLSGDVKLPLLREARDHPDDDIIGCAMRELGLTSAKGKAKALATDIPSGAAAPTNYSGITIGKSQSESPLKKDNASTTPRLKYPPSSPPAPTKRQAALDLDPSPVKKSRTGVQDSLKTNEQIAQAPPATLSNKRNIAFPKPSSAPSPQTVTFGSRGQDTTILGGNPNKEPGRLGPRKPTTSDQNHHQAPPRPSKPTIPRNHENGNSTASPTSPPPVPPPVPLLRNPPVRKNPFDEWGGFGDVPQPRPLKRAPAGYVSPPRASLKERLAAARDARLAENPEVDRTQQPAPQEKTTLARSRVNQPPGNKPPPNHVRANEPRRNPPQVKPKTPAKRPIRAAPLVRRRAPLQQGQKHARNPQYRQPDRRNEASEEDENDERYVNEYLNDRRGPVAHVVPKPSVGSFETYEQIVVKSMVRKAKPEIIAAGTFSWRTGDPGDIVPDVDTIVARAFAQACRERAQRFVLLTEHITCVKGLVTTYRHDVKDLIVPLVEKHLDFIDGQREYNRELSQWYLPHSFHEANPEGGNNNRLPFESNFIFKAVARALFGPSKLGLKHPGWFAPVPVRFIAFICSICNHVIYCYRRGSFNSDEHLNATMQEHSFQEYLEDLDDMHRHRAAALRQICASMYDRAREGAGHQPAPPVDRPRRNWGPDIAEEYIPRFVAPAVEPEDDGDDGDYSDYSDGRTQNRALARRNRGKQAHSRRESYGSCRQLGPRHANASDDDNHGEGPSKPYGVETSDEGEANGWPDDPDLVPSDEEMDG
ncbi:hypothetical protein BDV93DRAFT_566128 [Ceratobasidium sp. AG-I]|nr:hypothetical protein BDV93DRAFT_566128 [Ceratobasidium sp. AG-I]